MERRFRKNTFVFLMVFFVLLGSLVGSGIVSYAASISGKNTTVVYDGEYHKPDITITDVDSVTFYYTDEVTGESKSSAELPAFKEIGEHKVSYSVKIGTNSLSGSNTLTITEDPVTKCINRYKASIETFDGSLVYTDIDCSDLDIDVYVDDTKQYYSTAMSSILDYIWNDLYSDYWIDGFNAKFVKPERFWIKNASFQMDETTGKLKFFRIIFDTGITKSQFDTYRTGITSVEERILEPVDAYLSYLIENGTKGIGKEEIVLMIHDAMARELDFAYEKYKDGQGGADELHTSWGLLSNREGLCDGYAYLFKYFMDECGIECKVVYSEELNHVFNVVRVKDDSGWHVVDCAWDDLVVDDHTFTSSFSNVPSTPHTMYGDEDTDYNDLGYVSHAYLLQTAAQMQAYGYGESSSWYEVTAPGTFTTTSLENYSSETIECAYTDVEGGIPYVKGYCYIADASGQEKVITKTRLNNTETETIDTLFAVRYLQSDGNYLYYTNGKLLVRTDLDGKNSMICNAIGETGITELVYRDNLLYYTYIKNGSEITNSVDPTGDVWTATDGKIAVSVENYTGAYDGLNHSISVEAGSDVKITYSEDGKVYSDKKPVYSQTGEYTVYYKAECYGFAPVEDSATVTISKAAITVKAKDQSIVYGTALSTNVSDVEVSKGQLAAGESISSVKLVASTTELTKKGSITVKSVTIRNESDKDCTDQYEITCADGLLEITHDETLEPETVTVSAKTESVHIGNQVLAGDITVKASYADGYEMSVTDFTTNLDSIDWTTVGTKKITVTASIDGKDYDKSFDVVITDHSYDKGKVVEAATCSKVGKKVYTCTLCDVSYDEELAIDPSNHTWGEFVITKNATCMKDGTKTKTCSSCQITQEETVQAGPDFHQYKQSVTLPTCTEKGFTTSICSVCGDIVVSDYVLPKRHNWSAWVTTKDASCTSAGVKTAICTTCGEEKTEAITMSAHQYKETLHEATLTKDGSITKVCSVCNHEAEDKQIISRPKTLELDRKSYVYSGKKFTPGVEVTDANGDAIPEDSYTVKYTNNKKVGVAKVTVTFSGNYRGTKSDYFLIKPAKISKVTLKSGKKQLKASWSKQSSGIAGYEIQYATASNFRDKKTVVVKSASASSKMISSLKGKKKYYVRIRAYKTVKINGKSQKLYGDWSSKKYCTTK